MTGKDLSDWLGIGIGYVMLFCYAAVLVVVPLAPDDWDRGDRRGVFLVALLLLYGIGALAKRPSRRLVEWWADGSRERHEGLKNAAVTVMCLISAGLCVAAVPVAWRHSW